MPLIQHSGGRGQWISGLQSEPQDSQCNTEKPCLENERNPAKEMAQWLRAPTALPKVLSSIPSNYMVAHSHLLWELMPSSGVSEDSYSVLIYIKQIHKS